VQSLATTISTHNNQLISDGLYCILYYKLVPRLMLEASVNLPQKVTESQIQARHTGIVVQNKVNTGLYKQQTTSMISVILSDWPDQSLAEKCKPSKGPVLGLTNEARYAFRQSQRPTNSNQNCQAYLQPLDRLMTSQPNTKNSTISIHVLVTMNRDYNVSLPLCIRV